MSSAILLTLPLSLKVKARPGLPGMNTEIDIQYVVYSHGGDKEHLPASHLITSSLIYIVKVQQNILYCR